MKQILTILIFAFALCSFGQNIKEITIKHKNPWYTETYGVLKTNKNTKYGSYKKLGYENCLVIAGFYKDNKKDSLWTYYFWRSKQIEKQGKYNNDNRVEEWSFYSPDGNLLQTYDYSNQRLVYSIPPTKEITIIDNGKELQKILKSNPQFIGTTIELYEYITPSQMEMLNNKDYNIQTGKVIISFFVTPDAKAINHKIESGLSDKINQKCLEIVKSIPNLWIPGKDENGIVTSQYKISINFRIN